MLNVTKDVDVRVEFEEEEIVIQPVTGVSELAPANPLKAWLNNGVLHVSGLTEGKVWNLYSATGALVKQGIADSDVVKINLNIPAGVYIIQSEGNTLKIVIN